MASNPPLKSILKKPSTFPTPSPVPTSKEERNRSLALYHAHILQARRETEALILSSLETLIDYPLSPKTAASNPAPSDSQSFKSMLRPFRPSDYDDLILERNINEKCGYALCPNRRFKDDSIKPGTFRLIGKESEKDFKVVRKEELEMWCKEGNKCKKRAMWVKVQLDERPAWERMEQADEVELLDEGQERQVEDTQVTESMERLALKEESGYGQEKMSDAGALALERDDTGMASRNGLVNVTIEEKTTGAAAPPTMNDLSGRLDIMHLAVEGHTPIFNGEQIQHNEDIHELFG